MQNDVRFAAVSRHLQFGALALGAIAILILLSLPSSEAAPVGMRVITSTEGPLDKITLGNDLSCQVHHEADTPNQFYNPVNAPGACATFLYLAPIAYNGQPNGHCWEAPPNNCPDSGGNSNADGAAYTGGTPYTPVSQSAVTGTGQYGDPSIPAPDDPFTVVTVVDAGQVRVTETTTYFEGDEFYSTEILLDNRGSTPQSFILYRGVDCYLVESDEGYGWAGPSFVACSMNANNVPAARYQMYRVETTPYTWMEAEFGTVWSRIGSHQTLPNTCICATKEDNGMAIAWSGTLQPGQVLPFKSSLEFSPGPPPPVPPTAEIVVEPSVNTCENSAVKLTGVVSDPDGFIKKVQWTLGDGSTSSDVNVQHTYDNPGTYLVTLTVTDNKGLQATDSVSVASVGDMNCCPVMSNLRDLSVTEGQFFRFFAAVGDYEADPITYSITPAPPPGSMFDETSGYFFWRTAEGDAGTYSLTIRGTDGKLHPETCQDTDTAILEVKPRPLTTEPQDKDQDGIDDYADNCPAVQNLGQEDSNFDGVGDACSEIPTEETAPGAVYIPPPSPDVDADGVLDEADNCPGIPNSNQLDLDNDGSGDLCDEDLDGDGVVQKSLAKGAILDNCPRVSNADQADTGATGIGDACRPRALAAPLANQGVAGQQSGRSFGTLAPDNSLWYYVGFAFVAGVLCVGLVTFVVRRR